MSSRVEFHDAQIGLCTRESHGLQRNAPHREGANRGWVLPKHEATMGRRPLECTNFLQASRLSDSAVKQVESNSIPSFKPETFRTK